MTAVYFKILKPGVLIMAIPDQLIKRISVKSNFYVLLTLYIIFCNSPVKAEDPWPWAIEPSEGSVTLLLLGDFNVQKRENPLDALKHVRKTLNKADLVYANLEGLLVESRGADKDLPNKSGWTHLGPDAVKALRAGNIAAVGVANNVAYGRENIMASLSVLDANGIAHAGAGENIDKAHVPAIIEKKGVKFGFLQYTSKWYDESRQIATVDEAGVARLKSPDGSIIDPGDLERMLDDIKKAKQLVDILVVATHTRDGQGFGESSQRAAPVQASRPGADLYSLLPVNQNLQNAEPYQKQLAHAAIDAGADIVFGHGCHMLQAVEIYRNKPIMHCLGNFASDWIRVRNYRDGMVARIIIQDKSIKIVSLVPVTRDVDTNNVKLLTPDSTEGARLYRKIMELSPSTPLTIKGQEITLLDNR